MSARADAEATSQLPIVQLLSSSVSFVMPPLHMPSNIVVLPDGLPAEGKFGRHFGPASDDLASIKTLYRDACYVIRVVVHQP